MDVKFFLATQRMMIAQLKISGCNASLIRQDFGMIFRRWMSALGLAAALCAVQQSPACTIFVLTDGDQALFCNNEDWSDPNTRIWFLPAEGHYGCVYVGFDNGWAQGGMNTEGLAFDWVAGYKEEWQPDSQARPIVGNPSQRMLQTCATVDEAIAFHKAYREPSFSYARMLVADRTGASAVIGAKNGKLHVVRMNQSRGFGYAAETLDKLLGAAPKPTPADGARILQACTQKGKYATKYYNVFDLKSGDIFLHPSPKQSGELKLNLAAELKKGGHYYEMRAIRKQLKQSPKPLLENMQDFPLFRIKPIPDTEPAITARVRALFEAAAKGAMRPDDFTVESWERVSKEQADAQKLLASFGDLRAVTLMERSEKDAPRSYRYRLEFEKAKALQCFVFNEQRKVVRITTEDLE